jgi:hypothetical protein
MHRCTSAPARFLHDFHCCVEALPDALMHLFLRGLSHLKNKKFHQDIEKAHKHDMTTSTPNRCISASGNASTQQ